MVRRITAIEAVQGDMEQEILFLLRHRWEFSWKEWYGMYLKSEYWQDVRARKLNHRPFCEECGATKLLQIHHKEYNLFMERLSDLQVLCGECHQRQSEKHVNTNANKAPVSIRGHLYTTMRE